MMLRKEKLSLQTPSQEAKFPKKYNCCDYSQQRQEGRSDGQRSISSLVTRNLKQVRNLQRVGLSLGSVLKKL